MQKYPAVKFESFKGVWDRGNVDEVPINHLVDALNIKFNTLEGLFTRNGSIKGLAFAHPINDWLLSKRPDPVSIATISELIICDAAGNYYASSSPAIPILTIANGIALIGVNLFGRTYFCPIVTGYGGSDALYLYDGTQTRKAAGSGPPALPAMTYVNSGAGDIPPGKRTLYCAFLTDTGFLTPLGASVELNEVSAYKADISNIPIGPSTTTKRYLFSTQSGGSIPYFIPNAIIADNVTTTFAGLDFFDTDLQNSADYLFNLLPIVQSGGFAMGCIFFAGRLIIWPGPIANEGGSTIIGSRPGDFESFDQTNCYLNVKRDDGHNVITAFALNNVLYLCKDLGVYSTFDNGSDFDTWTVDRVDGSISIPPKGIAYLSTEESPIAGAVLVADKSGIIAFNGTFQRPELTWKVKAIWSRINQAAWNTVNLTVNPKTHEIYAAIPLDDAISPSHILYGDYSAAMSESLNDIDPLLVKWNLWQLPNNPTVVGMIDLTSGQYPVLTIGSIDNVGNLIQLSDAAIDDYGNPIESFMQSAYGFLQKSNKVGFSDYNSFFTMMKWNAFGTAKVTITGFGYNAKIQRQLFTKQLVAASGKDLLTPINFTSQKLSIKIAATSGSMLIDSIVLHTKPMFQMTPQ